MNAYEKGLALEEKLYQLFKSKGYEVVHNAKRKGRSGAEHQIDVLAEYRCPLHTSRVVVEAKSYDAPVNKDRIMKLMQIVDDIGADRGIIVTTSYFTSGAIKTAEGHNVELWDRRRLVELLGEMEISALEAGMPRKAAALERVVEPILSTDAACTIIRKILDRRARGGFLGRGKIIERLDAISMLYYPYYEAELEIRVSEVQKTGLFSKRTVVKIVTVRLDVDAITGDLVTVDESGISYPYSHLARINEDEINVLKAFRSFRATDLTGLGYSTGKARRIASGLVAKGVATKSRGKRGTLIYQIQVPFPRDPRLLKSISDVHATREGVEAKATFQTPAQDASAVIKALESYWTGATVKNLTTIYYPYFVYVLLAEDGSKRVEVLDAITGSLNKFLEKRVRWDIESMYPTR